MQNFTLGKKGITMLLFGLVLLIGSAPSYGQTCPTPVGTDGTQSFCYLQTVGDIQTDGDAVFQTANTTSDTQPIPASEILESGFYYAGSSIGSCERIAVNVTVNTTPYPDNTLYPGSTSFSISPCLNTDFSAEDLAGFFTPLTDYEIRVYETEFETGLASGQLSPNNSYYVGQVYTGTGLASDNCPSLRVAVGYNPANAPAPTATSPQEFCEGATVADLVAQGTSPFTQAIRWYRTNDSFQPLADSTILIDGETYYASQIINDRNDPFPPCESEDRVAVLVNVQQPVDLGTPEPGIICESDVQSTFPSIDEIRKYYLALLPEGAPTTGTFNPTPSQLATIYQNDPDGLGDFTTTYTVGNGECESSVDLTATIIPAIVANAGEDVVLNFNLSDGEQNLYSYLTGDANPNGFFVDYPNGTFNPSEEGAGTYTLTYTVDESTACVIGTDSATYTITVQDCDTNAGNDAVGIVCESDVQAIFPSVDEIRKYYLNLLDAGVAQDGTFNPTPAQMAQIYQNDPDGLGDFTTTYTVGDGSCQDSVELTVRVIPAIVANAGEDVVLNFNLSDEEQNLYTSLTEGANPDGFFVEYPNGTFNPAQEGTGTYTITYTVDESTACVIGTDSATFTITVQDCDANAGEDVIIDLCSAQIENFIANPAAALEFFSSIIDENVDQTGTFDPTLEAIAAQWVANPIGTFSSTYTVGEGECQDSALITINVTEGDANAGNDAVGIVCESDVQAIFPSVDEIRKYYLNLLDAGVAQDGTFNPTPAQMAQIYQNDPDGLGDFTTTYTVGDGSCQDSVELTVRVIPIEDANAGSIENIIVECESQGLIVLDDSILSEDATTGGTFTGDGINEDGNFDPSIGPGVYEITYSVNDQANCVTEGTEDSTTFTITVNAGDANAGLDNSIEVCNADVRNLGLVEVRNLYLSLLDEGISTNGTFNPTISELITQYNIVSNYGDFTATYTLGEGDCADSAVLTVTVIEANDAGADMDLSFCATEGPVNLFDYLSPYATANGTFEGLTDGIFDPSTATVGVTTVTYEVEDDESVCSTDNFTAIFTINVVAPAPANAGGNVTAIYCLDQNENIQLTSLLGTDALLTGSFSTPYANGVFNPSIAGTGEFVITYTVDGEGDCAIGTDSATITITVNDVSEAPVADAEQTFCLVDNNTVADLVASGDNIVWYEDEDLTTVAPATTPLDNGAVYYAVATGDDTCGSPSTMVTVTMNDPDAPTLQLEGNEFCRSDNPTLQDLLDNINGSGIQIYASLTGGTPLASTTVLENDVQYFATATDTTLGCESSERLAIRVEVAFCGIPEGFSPNGDNVNDTFVIPDIKIDFPNYNLEIFNRWGNVVFKGNASTDDWNGISNQSGTLGDGVLPVGVYFYILNYNDGATTPIQGKLYLSR